MPLSVVSSPCQSNYSSLFTEGWRAISHRGSSHRRTQSSPISPSPNVIDMASSCSGQFSHPYSSSSKQQRRNSILPVYDALSYMLEDDDHSDRRTSSEGRESHSYSNSRTLVMSWASETSEVMIDSNPNQPHQYDIDAEGSMASCRLSTARSMIKRALSPGEFGLKLARRASLLMPGPSQAEVNSKAGNSKGIKPSPLRMELEFARPKGGAGDDCSSGESDGQLEDSELLRSDPFGSSPHSKSFFIDSPSSTSTTPTPSIANPRRRTRSSASASKRRPGPTSFLSFSSPTSSSSSLVSPRTPNFATALVVPRYMCRHPASTESLPTSPCCSRRLSFRSRSEPESLRTSRSHFSSSLEFDPSRVRSLNPALSPSSDFSALESTVKPGRRRPIPSQNVFVDGRGGHITVHRTRSRSPPMVSKPAHATPPFASEPKISVVDGESNLDWRQFHEEMLEDESVLYLE